MAVVRLASPNGSAYDLSPGDVIGRVESAALSLNDPRVSEAHAMVSLRGSQLKLLALRGRLIVVGQPLLEVSLEPGLVIELAPGLPLTVLEVRLPDSLLTVTLDGGTPQVLSRVMSLLPGPPPKFASRPSPDALALAWTHHERVWLRGRDTPDQSVGAGESLSLPCHDQTITLTVQRCALSDLAAPSTFGGFTSLTLITHYDSIRVLPKGHPPLTIGGLPARLVSELALLGGPAPWVAVARELWRDGAGEDALRERWDATIGRLRKKLRSHGIVRDLVRMSGAGQVELDLGAHDRLENHA